MSFSQLVKGLCAAMLCVALAVPAFAADSFGRVVGYDKDKKTVTYIEDKLGWSNPKRPEFTVLPAKVVTLTADPGDMAPKAGGRLRVDYGAKEIIIYNPETKAIEAFPVEIVKIEENVEPGNALLKYGDKPKAFPVVDKGASTVTIYSARQKSIATVKVPAKYMSLPNATWDDGHNIKVTVEGDKATAFTNLSKAK